MGSGPWWSWSCWPTASTSPSNSRIIGRYRHQNYGKKSYMTPVSHTQGFYRGLWIRIDLIRIRIQHFCSIRIRFRIQAKTELLKTFSFSIFFEI
jgi:hypothetical protein